MNPRPVLVCRASNRGILIIGKEGETFYPKGAYPRVLWEDLPERRHYREEEFINECMKAVAMRDPRYLSSLPPEKARRMKFLCNKTVGIMLKLKLEAANSWSKGALRPFLKKHVAISKSERVSDLIINDLNDLRLDIEIPRPVLVTELLRLKDQLREV